ncbi:MAG: aldehyde dehydrogenase family protein [Neisseria sp.]|nr:aldehyde dehydrogenase family protein [Neisseria sp.]
MGLLHRLWQQWQKKSNSTASNQNNALFAVVPHFIDGERLTVATSEPIEVFNPQTARAERQLYAADQAQVDAAVASSLRAKKAWARTPVDKRLSILLAFRELLHAAATDLALVMMQEQGITQDTAHAEIRHALSLLDDAPQWTQRLGGRFTPNQHHTTDVLSQPEPVGIVLGIERSRLALAAPTWLISGALSCGNCVLLRPSIHHPSIAIFLADLLERAGLPKGVFNVVQGGQATADALLRHPQIDALIFHGALPQEISPTVSQSLTRTSLAITVDCRAAAVVMPDADMDAVARELVQAFAGGCQNGQHLAAVLAVGDAGVHIGTALHKAFSALHNTAAAELLVPLPSAAMFQAASAMQETLRQSGADIVWSHPPSGKGWHGGMMLVDFVTPDHALLQQESVLPILPIVRVPDSTAAQAVLAENPVFNSVGFFGNDLRTLHRLTAETGLRQIGINTLVRYPHPKVGLSGIDGDAALPFFTRNRTVAHYW